MNMKNWADDVPEGEVFPPIENLLLSFQSELSVLGGEVFVEKDREGVLSRLKELAHSNGWSKFGVGDPKLQKILVKNNFDVSSRDLVFDEIDAGVTFCEALIAQSGSIMVSSLGGSGRRMNVFPPVHIVLARKSQLVTSIEEGFIHIESTHNKRPSLITLISGPSRTADIEKTLVMGAHGPKELFVLIDSEE